MQHKTPQGSARNTMAGKPNPQREANREAIKQMAMDACARLGGFATIDTNNRYAVVDTTKFTVTPLVPVEVIPRGKSGIKDEEAEQLND